MRGIVCLRAGIFSHLFFALVPETTGSGAADVHRGTIVSKNDVSYEVVRMIGRGYYGEVFLVNQVGTDAHYALKIIRKELIREYDAQLSIEREIKLQKQLTHPSIVKLTDAFESLSEVYIITEYCEDGDLFEKFRSLDGISEQTAKMYMFQVCQGVQYLHDQNIIHRDIKPENIFLTVSGATKIGDFGFAKKLRRSGRETRAIGTNGFKAPEILDKRSGYLGSRRLIFYNHLWLVSPDPINGLAVYPTNQ